MFLSVQTISTKKWKSPNIKTNASYFTLVPVIFNQNLLAFTSNSPFFFCMLADLIFIVYVFLPKHVRSH